MSQAEGSPLQTRGFRRRHAKHRVRQPDASNTESDIMVRGRHTETATITAQAPVRVSVGRARRWFMELETHPERYRFETHAGFAFTQGGFGEIGAHFQTWERFFGLKLTLGFELTEVADTRFRFRLARPPLPVWGAFTIEPVDGEMVELRLAIGGTSRLGNWFLRLPLVRGAIGRQIRGEVEHIKASMEAV